MQLFSRNLKMTLLLSIVLFGMPSLSLSQTGEAYHNLLSEGITALEQNKLDLARQRFEAALNEDANGIEALYYIGVTHARSGRTKEAESDFLKVLSKERTFLPAHFDLGVLYYQTGEDEKAMKAFKVVERIDPDRARVHYYQGLILRRKGMTKEGDAKLEKAVSLDPGLAGDVHFLSGASEFQAGALDTAREEFQSVVNLTPEGELSRSAQDFLSKIDEIASKQKRLRLTAAFGLQSDDNVILEPRQSTAVASSITEKSDILGIVYLSAKYQWLKKGPWSSDLKYSYFQNFHQESELDDFDIQDNHLSLRGERRLGKNSLDLTYEFQFVSLGGDSFMLRHEIASNYILNHSGQHTSEVGYAYGSKDFKDSAALFPDNSDRNVNAHRLEIAHYILFSGKGTVFARYIFEKEIAGNLPVEDDWTYDGHTIKGGILLPPWYKVSLFIEGQLTRREYRHRNEVLPEKKREDDDLLLVLTLSRPLRKNLHLSAQYLRQENHANISAFNYRRNIVGLIATLTY